MIYIIDDKRSRQRDYGWDEERFSLYRGTIVPIWNFEDLLLNREFLIEQGNVVLFHESFLSSTDTKHSDSINSIKKELIEKRDLIFIAFFSGSKNARFVDGHICMLPPEVLYDNLEVFISNYITNNIDFKYLTFGDNHIIEGDIRRRWLKVIDENIDGEMVSVEKKILFAETKRDTIEHPFINCDVADNWDYFQNDVSDIELDGFINKWLSINKYDMIFIPLYFGNVYSDYMGLRLAMHIRLTMTINQNSIIYIYGVSSYEDIINECFDVLKLSGVYLIGANNKDLIDAAFRETNRVDITKELDLIHVTIPSNIGNNHSLANRWAISRWNNMLKWKLNTPQLPTQDFDKSLYFKYLVSKYGKRNKFKDCHKYPAKIDGIEGKTIVYIDDEYDKGWGIILRQIIEKESKATFLCFDRFDKKLSKKQLINRICEYIDNNNANCYLIDLRLHEDDFSEDSNLTGHEIAKYIKYKNKGNQIVVFTASNKIWNLKEEIFKIGAIGYALKESPELNYTRDESKQQFIEFSKTIKTGCDLSYLKELYDKQNQLKKLYPDISELDIIFELLAIDSGNNNPNILKSILLSEIVFLENYIKEVDNLSLNRKGVGITENVYLCKDNIIIQELTGHLFFKREEITKGHTNVIDVLYSSDLIEVPSFWCNVSISDATLTIAALRLYYNLPIQNVKEYIDIKLIRNTQVAHKGEMSENAVNKFHHILNLTVNQLVNFYFDVIAPIVLNSSNNNT